MGNTNCTGKVKVSDFTTSTNFEDVQLEFDSEKSAALCVGFSDARLQPVDCSINDANEMSKVLTGSLRFPQERVTLLAKQPTKKDIIDGLEKCARKVTKHGILIFYFSGHAIRDNKEIDNATKLTLLPAKFDKRRLKDTGIRFNDIKDMILTYCHAKYFLLVLDCCYAGHMTNELHQEVDTLEGTPWYMIASSAESEASWFHRLLKRGFFSYFFMEGLRRSSALKIATVNQDFPLRESLRFCTPFLDALYILRQPHNPSKQTPVFMIATADSVVMDYSQWFTSRDEILKAPDAVPGGWLVNYMTTDSVDHGSAAMPDIPTDLMEWLMDYATTALRTLNASDFLMEDGVLTICLAYMTRSLITLFHTNVRNPDLIYEVNYCILCVIRMCEALTRVQPSIVLNSKRCRGVLLQYINQVAKLTNPNLEDPTYNGLIRLIEKVSNRPDEMEVGGGGDMVDAPSGGQDGIRSVIIDELRTLEIQSNDRVFPDD